MSYSSSNNAFVASQLAKNGVSNTGIIVNGGVMSKANVVLSLANENHVLSVNNLVNGYYTTTTPWSAARTLTLPNVATLMAAMPNGLAGISFKFTINNTSTQNATLTPSADSTTTILSGATIATGSIKTFLVVITPAYPDPADLVEPITIIPAAAVVYPM